MGLGGDFLDDWGLGVPFTMGGRWTDTATGSGAF
jgi:hypothetical protein